MRLTRGQVSLRPWERADAERVRGWVNDPAVAERVGRASPVNDAGHAAWFDGMLRDPRVVPYAIEHDGAHVGNVWLFDLDWPNARAEVRILIGAPEVRGKGVGPTALQLISEHALRGLGLTRLYAYVLANNPPARRAFEKAGFALEATLVADRWVAGAFRDVWVLGLNAPGRRVPHDASSR